MKTLDFAKLVVDAASVRTRPNIYYLMPSATKLSFVAQQQRAFNLVWALGKLNLLRPNTHAAVIGSGLAGVAATCALMAHNCDVTVFEKAKQDMVRQRSTHHRMAHPEINFWPDIAPLTHTTNLPMLHWYFAPVADIIKLIDEQKHKITDGNAKYHRPNVPHTVEDVTCTRLDGVVTIKSTPACRVSFDVAIVAAGFEDDSGPVGQTAIEYWSDDLLEKAVQTGTPWKSFIISGAGDGGMIDALRCAYLNFHRGKLPVTVVDALSGTRLMDEVREAERSDVDARHHKYEDMATQILTLPEYKPILERLEFNEPGTVVLLDNKLPHVSESPGAPIHKLMIYCAMDRSVLKFHPLTPTPEEADDNYTLKGRRFPKATTRLITRHGARPRVHGFLYDHELERFEPKQRYLSEYNFCPLDIGEYQVAAPFESDKHGRLRDRRDYAEKALRELNDDNTLEIRATTDERFWARVTSVLPVRPGKLFGVPVEYGAEELPPHGGLT